MAKICIAVATAGTIKAKTALSIIDTVRLNRGHDFLPVFQHGPYIGENKEKMVQIAQENNCEHIFFVDHDMAFSHLVLPLLLANDKQIIGVTYNYRRLPLEPMTKFIGPDGATVTKLDEYPKETFKVAGLPGGLLLVRMTVFKYLTKPYFPMTFDANGHVMVSEDIGFCEKAKDAGYDLWTDPTIEVKHYGDYAY